MITGNSDYAITDELVALAPKNIKKWYCQNALSNHPIIEPLPIGLENGLESVRQNHGVSYTERADIREQLINKIQNIKPTINKIYANFNVWTNPYHRGLIKEACLTTEHIVWNEWHGDLDSYYASVADYSMVLCPAGNGIDTHRVWEMLYCNRIPIVIKIGKYNIYNMYEQLPIILLNNIEELKNQNLINIKYNLVMQTTYNINLLNIQYYINKIQKTI